MAGLSFENRSQPGELAHQSPAHVNEFTARRRFRRKNTRRGGHAMTQQSAKRIPQWLTIDLAIIIVTMALIGVVLWIAP